MGPLLLYALLPGIFRQACPQLHTLANMAQVQSFLTMIMMEAEDSMDIQYIIHIDELMYTSHTHSTTHD
jgi:hypothetical protein